MTHRFKHQGFVQTVRHILNRPPSARHLKRISLPPSRQTVAKRLSKPAVAQMGLLIRQSQKALEVVCSVRKEGVQVDPNTGDLQFHGTSDHMKQLEKHLKEYGIDVKDVSRRAQLKASAEPGAKREAYNVQKEGLRVDPSMGGLQFQGTSDYVEQVEEDEKL
mmetsp:Transcript_10947/g.18365  ORF Transcript_10947/g.18365 Transcript_10947/m.18365 type:complete len:162 (+) Transcript_10947:125-610(+)